MRFAGLDIDYDETDFLRVTEEDPLAHDAIWTRPIRRRPVECAYANARDLASALTIDNETETFAYVSGAFVFGDLLEALVEARRISVRRMHIQTLSVSDENIDSLKNVCLMSPVERLDLVLSGYWYATEIKKGGLVPYLFQELDMEGLDLRVAIAETHCKVVCAETLRGNTLTMHGSANMRSSSSLEQVWISPDRGLYDFCVGVGERIIEAYDVVRAEKRAYKSRRLGGGALWHAVTGTRTAEEESEAAEAEGTGAPATDDASGSSTATSNATATRASTPCTGTTSHSDVAGEVTGG